MIFRNASFASLYCYLISLAATQTVYGSNLSSMRWVALISFFSFGALSYFANGARRPLSSLNRSVAIYIVLWTCTVIFGVYPKFSFYRYLGHVLIIISSLVFLPQVITIKNSCWLPNLLKVIVGLTMIVSYLRPAPRTIFDTGNELRGIFGNANSFGHMCAVGALLFFHGVLTKGRTLWGYVQAAFMLLAIGLMFSSGARSSTISLMVGVITLLFFYKDRFSRNALIAWCILVAMVIAPIAFKSEITAFLIKHDDSVIKDPFSRFTGGRVSIINDSLEAFAERPVFGWGFGVDKTTDLSKWNGQFTSVGLSSRDPVNDFSYTLETGGITGLLAYILLLWQARKFWLTSGQLWARTRFIQGSDRDQLQSALENLQLFMALCVSLAVEFELDGTALSAGYFFAPLLWTSLGICASLYSLLLYSLPRQIWQSYFARRQRYLVSQCAEEG